MKKYLVGGAVRDILLKRPSQDLDYVVFETSESELLKSGYVKISKNFPVFSHPKYPESQFSLPRKDIKKGKGYNGFSVELENVSLIDDLERRDFTMNAMALDEETNTIIDPFGGQEDLKNKVIRHVGKHFVEDPLRVLRAARFKARYGFSIHPSTQKLIDEMMVMNMLKEITVSRFVKEFKTTESEGNLYQFFLALKEMDLLTHIFNSFDMNIVEKQIRFLSPDLSLTEALAILSFGQSSKNLQQCSLIKGFSNSEQTLIMALSMYGNSIMNYSSFTKAEKVKFYILGVSQNSVKTNVFKSPTKLIAWLFRLENSYLRDNHYDFFNYIFKLLIRMNLVTKSQKKPIISDWRKLNSVNLEEVQFSSNPKENRFNLLEKALL